MDRGYDSETLHQKIREEIGADSLIPVRKWKEKIYSRHYRQEMFDEFDREKYHQRNKVETAFSVLKRRFGESLKARKYYSQVKEIKIKIILHNITKAIQKRIIGLVIEEFYRARKSEIFSRSLSLPPPDPPLIAIGGGWQSPSSGSLVSLPRPYPVSGVRGRQSPGREVGEGGGFA